MLPNKREGCAGQTAVGEGASGDRKARRVVWHTDKDSKGRGRRAATERPHEGGWQTLHYGGT